MTLYWLNGREERALMAFCDAIGFKLDMDAESHRAAIGKYLDALDDKRKVLLPNCDQRDSK